MTKNVSPPSPRPRFSRRALVSSVALLAIFTVQALAAARRDSVTIDEFFHLPVGLHALYTGDLTQDPTNAQPPRMFAALPLLLDPPAFSPPPGANVIGLGYHFMAVNAARYQAIFVRARTMIVLISLGAAIVMAKWAFDLYGTGASLVCLALFAFSPSLLAHGHLVTLDMAGTLGLLIALYANWRLLVAPTIRRAVWLGLAVGAANLLKLSGPVLVAMVLVTWAIRIGQERQSRQSLQTWAALLVTVGAVALFVLNLGYGFDGTFSLLREATLAPGGKLAGLAQAAPWLRLPFPQPFIDGVDMILESGKVHDPSYFLAGELSAQGWWYYHLAAFAAKCPFPVLVAALFSSVAWIARRSRGKHDYALFVPVAVLFAANSAFNSLYIGERHVLAAYPLVFIGASPWLAAGLKTLPWLNGLAARPVPDRGTARTTAARQRTRYASQATKLVIWLPSASAAFILVWTALGTLAVAPRYLQYFNEAAGGSEQGHRVLIDSNIDWGQDLLRLREYMQREGVEQVDLAYFGRVDPSIYGISFVPLEKTSRAAHAVVSATFLMGRPYFWFLGGQMRWVPAETYSWLRERKPIARVGSMFVFDLR